MDTLKKYFCYIDLALMDWTWRITQMPVSIINQHRLEQLTIKCLLSAVATIKLKYLILVRIVGKLKLHSLFVQGRLKLSEFVN